MRRRKRESIPLYRPRSPLEQINADMARNYMESLVQSGMDEMDAWVKASEYFQSISAEMYSVTPSVRLVIDKATGKQSIEREP